MLLLNKDSRGLEMKSTLWDKGMHFNLEAKVETSLRLRLLSGRLTSGLFSSAPVAPASRASGTSLCLARILNGIS